eukprot:TRINITY_DN296_c0_g1_i2.p1 TRINITY_DN296_c0_g1~~TRINITY_DN296_c0_g1_i2.p1  ORF type:complete len:476 (+),score=106.70 TRINITY_DN296_c0_g1_i2:138-1565(+)
MAAIQATMCMNVHALPKGKAASLNRRSTGEHVLFRSAEWSQGSLRRLTFKASEDRLLVKKLQKKGPTGVTSMSLVPPSILDVETVDKGKFTAIPRKRTVFTFEDWRRHKSSGRYWRHIKTMLTSSVITSLAPPVAVMTGISVFVAIWNTLVASGALPAWIPILHLSNLPFSLTSPALSFLLVFRTNASYGRFDEARKMWGLMLNRTRDICRLALMYMARDENAEELPIRSQFLRHLQAFPLTYKHHFLQEGSLEEDLRNFTSLTDSEISGLLASTHRPNYCLQVMGECMCRCTMDNIPRFAMDQNMVTFADDIGGCERLFKTPVPLSYTRLTSRFLVLYHVFLPLALWDTLGWLSIPATIVHTAIFFCIEEVGVVIEEPFSILALDVIAASARNNVAELIALNDGIVKTVETRGQGAIEEESNGSAVTSAVTTAASDVPAYIPPPEEEYEPAGSEEDYAIITPPKKRAVIGPYSI